MKFPWQRDCGKADALRDCIRHMIERHDPPPQIVLKITELNAAGGDLPDETLWQVVTMAAERDQKELVKYVQARMKQPRIHLLTELQHNPLLAEKISDMSNLPLHFTDYVNAQLACCRKGEYQKLHLLLQEGQVLPVHELLPSAEYLAGEGNVYRLQKCLKAMNTTDPTLPQIRQDLLRKVVTQAKSAGAIWSVREGLEALNDTEGLIAFAHELRAAGNAEHACDLLRTTFRELSAQDNPVLQVCMSVIHEFLDHRDLDFETVFAAMETCIAAARKEEPFYEAN